MVQSQPTGDKTVGARVLKAALRRGPPFGAIPPPVCQGDAIAGIIPASLALGFPSDKAVRQPHPCTLQGLRAHTSGWRDSRKPSYAKAPEMR
jgi:hypothetical protein